MSGGSWDYSYMKVLDMGDALTHSTNPLRRAFGLHLQAVGRVMHDIEWADSGDTADADADASMRAFLTPQQEIAAAVSVAKEAHAALTAALARAGDST